jgi:glycosyltransferase involved in cell wall biosynthesis
LLTPVLGKPIAVATGAVIAAYNAEGHLADTLRSVWAQTRPVSEVVVVDDGSVDATAAIAADLGARTIVQANGGPVAARNRGRRELSSEIDHVLFLDHDDVLEPEMIEVLEDHLEAHPQAGLAYCRLRMIDVDGRLTGSRGGWPPRHGPGRFGRPRLIPDEVAETPLVSILDFVAIIPSVSLFRVEVFDRAGSWDEAYRDGADDTALAVEVAIHSEVHHIPRDLVRYRSHDGQISANTDQVMRNQRKLHSRLRSRGDPEIVEAWRIYDRQLVPHRGVDGVRTALLAWQPGTALRIAAGVGRALARSYAK